MSHSGLSICIFIILFIGCLHSASVHPFTDASKEPTSPLINVFDFMKYVLNEPDTSMQLIYLNQLREYLNRMCLDGYFGRENTDACQVVVDYLQQTSHSDNGREKRFFCNGFIGCKSSGR